MAHRVHVHRGAGELIFTFYFRIVCNQTDVMFWSQTLIPEWIMGFGLVLFGLAFTLIASGIVAEGFRHYRAHYAIRREERERKRGDGDEV